MYVQHWHVYSYAHTTLPNLNTIWVNKTIAWQYKTVLNEILFMLLISKTRTQKLFYFLFWRLIHKVNAASILNCTITVILSLFSYVVLFSHAIFVLWFLGNVVHTHHSAILSDAANFVRCIYHWLREVSGQPLLSRWFGLNAISGKPLNSMTKHYPSVSHTDCCNKLTRT